MERRDLKPLWLQCLRELFQEAEKNNLKEVSIRASKLKKKGEEKFPEEDFNVFPSICNAMRSIMESDDKVIEDTPSHNSSTYTICYKLPRKNPIPNMKIESIEQMKVGSNKSFDNKFEQYYDLLVKRFPNKNYQKECIEKCENLYRNDDAGRLLYRPIVSYQNDKFTDDYIKRVYNLLKKWNMDQKKAKLAHLELFKESIINNKEIIIKLSEYTLTDFDKTDKTIELIKLVEELYNNLNLVQTKSPLVTFSKTLHFFLPNLIAPIDRKYTCNFFNIRPNQKKDKEKEEQLNIFINLHKAFSKFAQQFDLSNFVNKSSDWNLNIPKIIDNMIIGHFK